MNTTITYNNYTLFLTHNNEENNNNFIYELNQLIIKNIKEPINKQDLYKIINAETIKMYENKLQCTY